MNSQSCVLVKFLGCVDYNDTLAAMRNFTQERNSETQDELWLLEHPPVFTQGQAGKAEHLLSATDIPLVQSDRGGQVTYHGPGQLVAYPLFDLRRLKVNVRELVSGLENAVIEFLSYYGIQSNAKPDAPGVYVAGKKIASLGLRVRKGCSFHGVAINIAMDLKPFLSINPCGYEGLEMVQLQDLISESTLPTMRQASEQFAQCLGEKFNLNLTWAESDEDKSIFIS